MEWLITSTVRLLAAVKRVMERKWSFLGIFAVVFLGIVFVLAQYGLLPEASPEKATLPTNSSTTVSSKPIVSVEEPVKIEIKKISLVADIANPTSTKAEILDTDLLKGAVRYPTSAKLGEAGNVVLFGHSSYLPVVGNQAYKAFNGIQKLVVGDVITVYSSDAAYEYRVKSVEKQSAASDAGIDLAVAGRVLTLVTCDSFATKSDRFIVTADFVESHSFPL